MSEVGVTSSTRVRDRLVGRETELALLREQLAVPAAVVSVFGQSGVGRSRLVAEAMRTVTTPVVRLDCAGLSSSTALVDRLLAATDRPLAAADGTGSLAPLRGVDLLVVLEDVDPLREQLPEVLVELTSLDGPRCVTTSVLPLPRSATASLGVEPLGLPGHDGPEPEAGEEESDATTLFVTRAREVSPDFVLDDESRPLVATLVRRLDGVPLAIELAAARHGLLGLDALVRMTEATAHRLDVLGGRSDDRRSSMAAALEWTVQQLASEQRSLVATLSVFAGDTDPSALAEIHGGELTAVLDALSTLVDLRLVEPVPGRSGERRFRLRPLVAAAASTTPVADADALRCRHARYYAAEAARGAGLILDGRDDEIGAGIVDDLAEMERAAGWLAAYGDLSGALACAADLTCLLAPQAGVHRTRRLLRQLLSSVPADDDPVTARARLAAAASELAVATAPDDAAHATELWKRGFGAVTDGDPRLALWAHSIRVRALPVTGDFAAAASSAGAGLSLAEQMGHPVWRARFEAWAGMVHHQLRDYPRAVELGRQALRRSLTTGDRFAQIRVGMLLHQIPAAHWSGDPLLPSLDGLLEDAEALHDVEMQRRLLANLVLARVHAADLTGAGDAVARLLEMAAPAWGPREAVAALAVAAAWAGAIGEHSEVARLHSVVRPWEQVLLAGMPPAGADRYREGLAAARSQLGDAGYASALAEGAGVSVDEHRRRARALVARHRCTEPAVAEPAPRVDELSPREEQVLALLVEGRRNKEIAERLGASPKSVMHCTSAIYRKLGVRGRAEAAVVAVRERLVVRG